MKYINNKKSENSSIQANWRTPLFCERLLPRKTEHFPFEGEQYGSKENMSSTFAPCEGSWLRVTEAEGYQKKVTPLFCERLLPRKTEHFPFEGEKYGSKENMSSAFAPCEGSWLRITKAEGYY
ncbi:MAG: hypothetical protein K9N09_07750 [Candidatus Cloacimonetes bacterium]|nr:hypothetical protein [Candidatus Cloacimonadota bacterium]MCF7813501.1 hypothetical protein [Candidatus Cloacimonadota bacterium]MCF7868576.1 hypothetical protein [Candidatus Cloacimonadota bacterium]